MSTNTPQLKRHNHRVHPCTIENKNELLKVLLNNNSSLNIIVVTANDAEALKEVVQNEKITIVNDAELASSPELTCDMLISYDLPEKALIYMARISHTKTHALILLDKSEQKLLYPVETLIGRSLMQENIKGFEDLSLIPKVREDKRSFDKSDRPKSDYKKDDSNQKKSDNWNKQDKSPSKYLGKDENGKPIFSGKTRERNHRYDGKPKEDTSSYTKKHDSGESKYSKSTESKSSDKPRSYDKKKSYGDKEQGRSYGGGSNSKPSYNTDKKSAPKKTPRKINIKPKKESKES